MALKRWKKTGQRTLLEHPRLNVYEDDVILPDGTPSSYIHFGTEKKTNSVAIIAIREDGKFLLQKELSYPIGEFLWRWPGGTVESGETIEEAANRELMEEAGFRAGQLTVLGSLYVNNRRTANKQAVVLARQLTEETAPSDAEEFFEYTWCTHEEVQQFIAQGKLNNCHALAAWALFCAHDR